MNTHKKLSAKLNFTKQTVAKLNEETMALMRGGAAGAGAEGFNFGVTEAATLTCGSSTDITCQTQSQGLTM
jgi:hypothetical protein